MAQNNIRFDDATNHSDEATDPFYSESNMNYLRELLKEIDEGRATFVTKTWSELEGYIT